MTGAWTDSTSYAFTTEELTGELRWCPDDELCNHRSAELVHRASGRRLSTEACHGAQSRFGFGLFRVLARDAYLGELRSMPARCERLDAGMRLTWAPSLAHRAEISALFRPRQPGCIDCEITVVGREHYRDYELLIAAYQPPGFTPSAWVTAGAHGGEPERIAVRDDPVFHGLYNFFPRDTRAAGILCDGRGQRGRWRWRVNVGRLYAAPVVASGDGVCELRLLGLAGDVSAVACSYAGDEACDSVADHRGVYLSLFGRDLHPGEGWRTTVRLQVGDAVDPTAALRAVEALAVEHATTPTTFEVGPAQ